MLLVLECADSQMTTIVDVVRASEEAGTDSEQSAQMQQGLILDRISMAAADPAEAKERLGAYNS